MSSGDASPRVLTIEGQGSWRSRALNLVLRLASGSTLNPDADFAALRERYERMDARCFPLHRSVRREAVDCDGVPAHWVSVPQSLPGRTLFYLHGGSFAFRFPHAQTAFAARLCRQLRASALVPDYRLAPEHPFPAAPDDCERAWHWALAHGCRPGNTVFVGDSAGGTLSLVTLNRSLRNSEPLPACAVLLSPAVDCTLASPSITDNHRFDAVISLPRLLALREGYVPSPELYRHPDVSPFFADFSGFPPLFMQAGSTELLRDEALRVADKACAAGVDVEVELWPSVPHAFQLAAFLPEAALAMKRITAFVVARTGWQV
ncbi:MAG: alpha/beta hydrolase [Pseudomonadota bacterium]